MGNMVITGRYAFVTDIYYNKVAISLCWRHFGLPDVVFVSKLNRRYSVGLMESLQEVWRREGYTIGKVGIVYAGDRYLVNASRKLTQREVLEYIGTSKEKEAKIFAEALYSATDPDGCHPRHVIVTL